MRPRALVALLSLALAAGTFAILRLGPGGQGGGAEQAAARSSGEAAEPPSLTARPVLDSVATPRAERPSQPAPATQPPVPRAPAGDAPDPVRKGSSSLVVRVTDDRGARAAMTLELWRIAAPGNEHWTDGDQLQAEGRLEDGRVEWNGLPEGKYRLSSPDARRGSEDPPAFEVRGERTLIDVVFMSPRDLPVWLAVVDEHGEPLREGAREVWGSDSIRRSRSTPGWHTPRLQRADPDSSDVGRTRRVGSTWHHMAVPGEHGFQLGTWREASRDHETEWEGTVAFRGRTTVSLEGEASDLGGPAPVRYVGVSVPLEAITSSVVLPDGTPALEAGAQVHASARALRLKDGQVPPRPAFFPITVQVTLAGYETLEFKTHAGGVLPRRVLTKVPTKE